MEMQLYVYNPDSSKEDFPFNIAQNLLFREYYNGICPHISNGNAVIYSMNLQRERKASRLITDWKSKQHEYENISVFHFGGFYFFYL